MSRRYAAGHGDLSPPGASAGHRRHHEHRHALPDPDDTAETYWDGFYRGLNRPADSAPGPNALFVDEVGPLSPGTALDLGCGFVRGST
jgi:hypothetical protein